MWNYVKATGKDSPPTAKEKASCYMQQAPYYREQKHLRS